VRATFAAAAVLWTALAAAASPGKDAFAAILAARVDEGGEVAYRSLARHDRAGLDRFLDEVAAADPQRFDHDHAIAFWMNAYHAAVIAAVLHGEHPETVESRAKMYHWFGLPIAGERRTLDGIRAILDRYATADPRIHLALCDGTRGGPRMPRQLYEPEYLDAQLAAAARRFVDDPLKNHAGPSGQVKASRIFEWYRADFEHAAGTLADFMRSRATNPDLLRALGGPAPVIEFAEYDWGLDAAANQRLQ
jgi:Protein of unknown function, DUF547